jgi:hypothetical protein
MSQKSSLPQSPRTVQLVLTGNRNTQCEREDKSEHRDCHLLGVLRVNKHRAAVAAGTPRESSVFAFWLHINRRAASRRLAAAIAGSMRGQGGEPTRSLPSHRRSFINCHTPQRCRSTEPRDVRLGDATQSALAKRKTSEHSDSFTFAISSS